MYLYIFEDGTLRQSQLAPTSTDMECIGDGILQVICQVGAKYVETDRAAAAEGRVVFNDIPDAVQDDGFTATEKSNAEADYP